jgi:hypothetical protein
MLRWIGTFFFGVMFASVALYFFISRDEKTTSWHELRVMSRERTVKKSINVEGYIVSSWVNPDGDKNSVECWTLIVEQHPLIDMNSQYLVVDFGFYVVPEKSTFRKVIVNGEYTNDPKLFKPADNLGQLSKVKSIRLIDMTEAERDRLVSGVVIHKK